MKLNHESLHANNRISLISLPNEFPGYRSVVLFQHSSLITLATISSDGRLNANVSMPAIRKITPFSSLQDALFLLESKPEEWRIMDRPDIDMVLFGSGSDMDTWLPGWKEYPETLISSSSSVPQAKAIESLRKQMQYDFNQGRRALCNALDRDVLKTMRGTGLASIREGRWLTGGDGVSPEIILARKQAVCAYPILARQFVGNASPMGKAIDAKTSLSDAIAAHFHLDEVGRQRRVKRLQGLTWQRAAAHPANVSQRAWDILYLPEGTVPKTRKQFKKFDVFEEFGESIFNEGLYAIMKRLSREGNPWKFIDRMEQTSGRNVADAVDFLIRKLYVPAILNKINMFSVNHGIKNPDVLHERMLTFMSTAAREALLSDFTFRKLLDWSDRYHRNIARYEDLLVTINLNQDWPAILGVIKFGNDHVVRELTSSRALKTQGLEENHCVGGYTPFILEGEYNLSNEAVLIFSIEKNNEIISTAEIACTRKPCYSIDPETGRKTKTFKIKARIADNLASNNKASSRDANRIANKIARKLEQVKPKKWLVYLDGLEHSKAGQDRISGINAQIRNCEFDPFDRAMMKQVWVELSPALPRHLREKGLDGFINKAPVDRAILENLFGKDNLDFYDGNQDIEQKIHRDIRGRTGFQSLISPDDFNRV